MKNNLERNSKSDKIKTSPREGEVETKCRVRGIKNITTSTKLASPAPVILGPVPRILLQQGTDLVNKLALLLHKCKLREDSQNKSENDWCWGRRLGTFSQSGRSMIEMLGVLAIIAVLSIGGLAGYSKAMEMWKINKAKAEYSYYIFGMLKYREEGKKLTQEGTSNQIILTDIAEAEGLVPPNWKKYGVQGQYMHIDSLGNLVYVFSRNGHLSFSISMTKIREGKVVSTKNLRQLCSNLMLDIIQPLHSVVYNVFVEAPRNYWGDSYCTNGAWCLKDMKVADVQNICNLCVDGGCYFILSF